MADETAPERRAPETDWASRAAAVAALVLALLALVFVFATSLGGSGEDPAAPVAGQGAKNAEAGNGEGAVNPKTYVVETGDTLSHIADKFSVSVKRLRRLNPDIDPQALGTGQELNIR